MMGLVRIGLGADEPLETFYAHLGRDNFMWKVVQSVDQTLGEREVFCLTSHTSLALLSQPDHAAVWWVQIHSRSPINAVRLECVPPARNVPWRGARVVYETDCAQEATTTVLEMIDYSEGWDTSHPTWSRMLRTEM